MYDVSDPLSEPYDYGWHPFLVQSQYDDYLKGVVHGPEAPVHFILGSAGYYEETEDEAEEEEGDEDLGPP